MVRASSRQSTASKASSKAGSGSSTPPKVATASKGKKAAAAANGNGVNGDHDENTPPASPVSSTTKSTTTTTTTKGGRPSRKSTRPVAAPAKAEKPTKAPVGKRAAAAKASTSKAAKAPVAKTSPKPKAAPAKRKLKSEAVPAPAKKVKLDFRLDENVANGGVILALGQGDTGQLGLGEDIMERSKPALVKELQDETIVDVCAGGMHSLALTKSGQVYSFGCNDEGALGRHTEDDDECYTPAEVKLPEGSSSTRIVQICAGDSHSVALAEDGKAYYWGTFRDSSGSFGLTSNGMEKLPVPLAPNLVIQKIATGATHVVLLTMTGELYTVGCGEQGQLGRVGERFVARGGRRGLKLLLEPDRVHAKNRKTVFTDVWAGSYGTYALTKNDEILVCGLNNYNQLGVEKGHMFYSMVKSESFSNIAKSSGWRDITPGQHHALALDKKGSVHAIGRVEYGRLGLGEEIKVDAKVPTPIPALKDTKIVNVSCGTAVSFAVAESGDVYSWGMGTNGQLGHEDDEDSWKPENMIGKQLEERKVLLASGGGQHTLLLAVGK